MTKLRLFLLLLVFGFFISFVVSNSRLVNVTIPFFKTFSNIPLCVVISISFVIGVIFHIIMGGKVEKKK